MRAATGMRLAIQILREHRLQMEPLIRMLACEMTDAFAVLFVRSIEGRHRDDVRPHPRRQHPSAPVR